jgi:DNA-directed RNA polymerase beta' subunit
MEKSCSIFQKKLADPILLYFSGHFGSVELPVPIYHPSHVTELKRMLSLVCLKLKKIKVSLKKGMRTHSFLAF